MALSTKEVCKAITEDLKKRRYTHKMAAEKIGTTPQNMSNMLSGRRQFSRNMAQKFSEQFGYSIEWLLYGEGEMFEAGHGHFYTEHDEANNVASLYYIGNYEPILKEGRKLRAAERLLEILNNKVAIAAFQAYIEEDYEKYEELRDILESDYSYNIPLTVRNNPKATEALRNMRKFFVDAETASAKELVIIEQRAAAGEIIAVDAELERFKKKLLILQDAYKDGTK